MKKIFAALLMSSLLAACGERAAPGSPLAARFMAAEFIGKLYNVDPVHVYEEPVISDDSASVTAVFKDQKCSLELVKQPDANKYGWVTKNVDCQKSA